MKDDQSYRLGAENFFQSHSKKIERGDQACCPDSFGIIESRKDMQRNSKSQGEFSEEYAQLRNEVVIAIF